MNDISHKQAVQWIHRRMDGLLNKSQLLSLEEHLRSCDSCRAYAINMDGLSAHLQNAFHRRWDENSGPSQNVMEQVTAKARRIPVTNRISSGAKLVTGAMALLVLALAINFVVSRLQSSSPVANATEIVDNVSHAEDRLLAFTSVQNGNADIYSVHADGSGLTNITNHPAYDANPFWSPDGKRIAFESDRNGFTHIFLMNADGSDLFQVTNGKAQHQIPSSNPWSPDGSSLIFTEWAPEDEKWTLYTIGVDGQNKTPLAPVPNIYSYPSWSPDGKHIAFSMLEPQGDRDMLRIYVVDANGNELTNVTKFVPADEDLISTDYFWSSDGQSIFLIAGRIAWDSADGTSSRYAAYEATLDGETLTEKAASSTQMNDWWGGTAFLFSSKSKAFTWLRSDGTYNTLKPLEKCEGNNNSQFGYSYKRSLNGNLFIGATCPNGDLWLYWANPDGTLIKQLLNVPISALHLSLSNITWSPDDKFVAFNISSNDLTDLYILNVEAALNDPSAEPLKMTTGGGEPFYNSSWQPTP